MKSLRASIKSSWIPEMRLLRGDLAAALGLPQPLSLTVLTRLFAQPEIRSFRAHLAAEGIAGDTEILLRSDGTYTFRGHLEATGFPSFAYRLQASVIGSGGIVVALETRSRVFGDDTPGPSRREWNEDGFAPALRDLWTSLRQDSRLETDLQKNLAGLLGTLADVAQTVVETYVAGQLSGVVGAVIVLGGELGAATGATFSNPKLLAGVSVGSGILLVFGPSAVIPALAAGIGTAVLTSIQFRPMNEAEIALAFQVFGGTLPVERILITNLYNPSDTPKGFLAREFTVPGFADGKILVNMGKNFDNTLGPDNQQEIRGKAYAAPGQVLVHELTHAWQIHHAPFLPGLLCKALASANYDYHEEAARKHESWSQSFDLEGQAAIVDSWFGDNRADLNGPGSLNDFRFFYLAQHIRAGRN